METGAKVIIAFLVAVVAAALFVSIREHLTQEKMPDEFYQSERRLKRAERDRAAILERAAERESVIEQLDKEISDHRKEMLRAAGRDVSRMDAESVRLEFERLFKR